MTSRLAWYAVQAKQREEPRAAHALQAQKFPVFYPRVVLPKLGLRPLFQGYLFVAFDIADTTWRRIVSTRGVKRLLGPPEEPEPIRLKDIERIRALLVDDVMVLAEKPCAPRVAVCDRVRIVGGSFEGHRGVCQKVGVNAIQVEITLFRRQLPVWVLPQWVERA